MTLRGDVAWLFNVKTLLDEPAYISPEEARRLVLALHELSCEAVERVLRLQAPCSSYIPSTCEVLACRAHARVLDMRRAAAEAAEGFAQVREQVNMMVLDAVRRTAEA